MDKTTKKTSELSLFSEIFALGSSSGHKVEVDYNAPDLSLQGGLFLLREFEQGIFYFLCFISMITGLESSFKPAAISFSFPFSSPFL